MRRSLILGAVLLAIGAAIGGIAWAFTEGNRPPILLGILHSKTGPMAISEQSMIDAEELAIDEINARGGLLGRPVKGVVADGKSDPATFAQQAERLINDEKVDVIVGCWTSASRKSVLPVVERANHLLIYPMAYEGVEISPNIIYTGGSANQQVLPALRWSYDALKARKFFLIGSDYVWPHTVNEIVKDALKGMGAELAGEEYCAFGTSDVREMVAKIKAVKPDVVLSTIAGETNIAFYKSLRQAGITPDQVPVISCSIAENELSKMDAKDVTGHYSAWNYFQTVDRLENEEFVRKFKAKYGADRVMNDVTVAAYNSVRLWAQAVEEADSADVKTALKYLLRQSLDAPEGVISIDPETHHTWRPFYLGRARSDGQFDLAWSLVKPIRPEPYPITRSRSEWDRFLEDMHARWGGSWANPNTPARSPAPD
jgi:urea transport system substrate-binding protein